MMKRDYKKKYEFQKKISSRQAEQIESLKKQIEKLKLECEEKDKIIKSVDSLRAELTEEVNRYKKLKTEFENLVKELRKMKNIINQTVFKGRWKLIKFLIK